MNYHTRLTYLFDKGVEQLTNKEGVEVFKILTYLGLDNELKAFRFDWYATRLTNLYDIQKDTPDLIDLECNECKLDHLKKLTLGKLSHDAKRSEMFANMVELTREDIQNTYQQGLAWEKIYFPEGTPYSGSQQHIECTRKLASYIDELYGVLVKGGKELVKESYREYTFSSSGDLSTRLRTRLLRQKGVNSLTDLEFIELLGYLRDQGLFDEVSELVLKRAFHQKRRMVHPISKGK